MFWVDYGQEPRIERAHMDGSERTTIVSRASPFSNLRYPNDVVIDFTTEFLYFIDGSAGFIGVVSFSGTGKIVVPASEPYIRKPFSLTLRHLSEQYQDGDSETEEATLYWSDRNYYSFARTDIVTRNSRISGIEHMSLRGILPRSTQYPPYGVQFVSMSGHKEGGMYVIILHVCLCY